ncbi:MAG: SIMPL domain-containing protein [Candidatus Paceibacterota bacterium]|jgi:hypothetical protein
MNKDSIVFAGLLLGLCIIISTAVGGYSFYNVRSLDNSLTVTGSAKMSVKSDTVKWTTFFVRAVDVSTLKDGYAKMASDLIAVKKFYADNGYADKDLIISPVFMEEIYNPNGNAQNKQYQLRQTIELNSITDLEKVTGLSKNTQSLIDSGVVFSTQSLEYYYSKLPDLRVKLLAAALADAKARAVEIAKAGGRSVGALKSASSGVVQVLPPNSVDVSDYGNYDTSSVNKEVMVTAKASFVIK